MSQQRITHKSITVEEGAGGSIDSILAEVLGDPTIRALIQSGKYRIDSVTVRETTIKPPTSTTAKDCNDAKEA